VKKTLDLSSRSGRREHNKRKNLSGGLAARGKLCVGGLALRTVLPINDLTVVFYFLEVHRTEEKNSLTSSIGRLTQKTKIREHRNSRAVRRRCSFSKCTKFFVRLVNLKQISAVPKKKSYPEDVLQGKTSQRNLRTSTTEGRRSGGPNQKTKEDWRSVQERHKSRG